MTNSRILINGAGIAGAALAWWLRHRGFGVTLVERAPAPRRGGQTVDLRGAGRTVIERMGLLERVRAVEVEQRGIAWVDRRGRRIGQMPVEAFGGRGVISADEVLRGDLADLLLAAAREPAAGGLDLVFDDTVTAVRSHPDGVEVEFENGAPRRFALVVGADGLHSAVRRCAFGPETDYLRPVGLATAWFTIPAEIELRGWYLMHNAAGGRVCSVRPGRRPGEHKANLSVRTRADETLPDRRDRAAQLGWLDQRFADVGWEVQRVLAGAHRADDFTFETVGQVKMPRWSSGRATLIGDAACSPSLLTGLGTSLALVGAYVLAGELATYGVGDGLPAALDRYEALVRPYAAQAQELPPGGAAGYAPRSSLMRRLSLLTMSWSTRWPLRPLFERLFSRADAIELPGYPTPVEDSAAVRIS